MTRMYVGQDGLNKDGVNTLGISSLKNVNVGALCGILSAKADTYIADVAYVQIRVNTCLNNGRQLCLLRNHVEKKVQD